MFGYISNLTPVSARIERILRSMPVHLDRILDISHDRFSGVNTSVNTRWDDGTDKKAQVISMV